MMRSLNLKQPSRQRGSDGVLEADHKPPLHAEDPSDFAKSLKELPHNGRPLPGDGQALRLDEDLVVAGEGRQVVHVHVGVDQAALHLDNSVVDALGGIFVVEEQEASCLVGAAEVDVEDLDAQLGDA